METPRVQVSVLDCRPAAGGPRRWQVSWLVSNAGTAPLELQAAWIPHGRFRGQGRVPLSGSIDPDRSVELAFLVTADEAPLTVVKNAFLILRVRVRQQVWQIFTRMRIEFDTTGVPNPIVEVVTMQSIE